MIKGGSPKWMIEAGWNQRAIHIWIWRFGLHFFYPDVWKTRLDSISKQEWKAFNA